MSEPVYLQYQAINFSRDRLELIRQANKIISEYEGQKLSLSVRQLFYQFIARGLLPNTAQTYNRIQSMVSDARMAGLISWTAIEDRGRDLRGLNSFESPAQAVASVRSGYRRDLWANQPWRPEVWVEKAALEGVISGICNQLRVDFFATRGYNSQSEQWRAGRRFADYVRRGQRPIVFHLGDHDPEGIDMTRDNRERLSLFCVPAAIAALTGEPLDAVIVPALNRHAGEVHLGDTVAGVSTATVGAAVLRELGYQVRPYRGDAKSGPVLAHLATWARRSREKWPGRTILVTTRTHCLVVADGVVYDNWTPHGVLGAEHPYAKTTVKWAALVEKENVT